MGNRPADHLWGVCHRFVGRESERALFQRVPVANEFPFSLLRIVSPGGVGKTALRNTCVSLAHEAGAILSYLDVQTLDGAPAAFTAVLQARCVSLSEGVPLDHWPHPGSGTYSSA